MNNKENDSQKSKFKLIEGNPNAGKKVKREEPPVYIKAAVMGSRRPDIASVDTKVLNKINSAIEEYRKLVEETPDDLTLTNTLGDLLIRAGETQEAVFWFNKIAIQYYSQRQLVKALAIYKKISKLTPNDPFTNDKIFELYTRLGLR